MKVIPALQCILVYLTQHMCKRWYMYIHAHDVLHVTNFTNLNLPDSVTTFIGHWSRSLSTRFPRGTSSAVRRGGRTCYAADAAARAVPVVAVVAMPPAWHYKIAGAFFGSASLR